MNKSIHKSEKSGAKLTNVLKGACLGLALLGVPTSGMALTMAMGTANCLNWGECRKQAGYTPEFQEAVGILQSIQGQVQMQTLSPELQAKIAEHRQKMIADQGDQGELTDLEVLQDFVKSNASPLAGHGPAKEAETR